MNAESPSESVSLERPAEVVLWGPGIPLDPAEAERIWREILQGRWRTLAAADQQGMRHLAMRRVPERAPMDWNRLGDRERAVIALAANGFAQKVIAITLGLAPATVSGTLAAAQSRLGFTSLAELVCAYGGTFGAM